MTEQLLSDHANTIVYHESLLSRALGVIPYQPITDTAHVFTFHTKTKDSFHGFFVFQSLHLIFLDDHTVVDTHVLRPFTTYRPSESYNTVIELTANTEEHGIQPGDVIKNDL